MAKTKYQSVYWQEPKNGRRGFFYYAVYLGKDPLTGKTLIKKSQQDHFGHRFKTARDAYLEAERIREEHRHGESVMPSNMTLEEFVNQLFKPTYKTKVEESTWIAKQPVFDLILTHLGNNRLSRIMPGDCLMFRNWLLSDQADYSQTFASMVYGTFRQILDTAVDLDYLSKSPARMKKATGAIAKGKHTINYWTLEEFKKVVSKCYLGDIEGALAYVMLNLYYFTGMRVSEALALWWSDINLEERFINVSHTMTNSSNPEKRRKNYTKTINGMRTIDIPQDLADLLKWWKDIQYDNLPQEGDDHYVLTPTDQPMHRSSVNNIIKRYADLAGVHRIQAKELRASHACLLINKYNVDILAVAQRLGHAKPTTTLQYYAQLWRGRNRAVADQLNGAMGCISHPDHSLVNFAGNQYVHL